MITTPSRTSERDGRHAIANSASGIGIHQGQAASQSEPMLASDHFFKNVTKSCPSPLSAPPLSATVISDSKPLPASPSPVTPLIFDIPELPGSILLKNQGLPTAEEKRQQLRLSCEKLSLATPARKESRFEDQVPDLSRRSEDSVNSQSTSESPFTKSPVSEFEVSPITLHSETASPSTPYLSLAWRAKAASPHMGGKTDAMDHTAEARRAALSLEQRVKKLEGLLKERDGTISSLHRELKDAKAGRQEQLQSPRIESHVPHQTRVLKPTNESGEMANREQDEVHQLRHAVQQKNIEISILEEEILRWKVDVDHLENKIMSFIDLLREPSNQETFQSRAFQALEDGLLDDEIIIQPLQPKKRAASLNPEPQNVPLPLSPADAISLNREIPSPTFNNRDDASAPLREALKRIEDLEAKVQHQAEDIKWYKLDVRGYKKDVRERNEKIKMLQREILDLQDRLGGAEREVFLSDIPLGIDLGGGMIVGNDTITSSLAATSLAPTFSAPAVPAQAPAALESHPVPQEAPKPPTIPETPTPEPRGPQQQQQQQQQQQPSNRAAPRQHSVPRTSTRTRHPRCAPIIEETNLPDSPTLAEPPTPFPRRWRQVPSPRDPREPARLSPRRPVSMTSMSLPTSVMEDKSKEGGKVDGQSKVTSSPQQRPQVQSQYSDRSRLHDPFDNAHWPLISLKRRFLLDILPSIESPVQPHTKKPSPSSKKVVVVHEDPVDVQMADQKLMTQDLVEMEELLQRELDSLPPEMMSRAMRLRHGCATGNRHGSAE
ncbi:MAG: hypothetical protein M1816_005566 [Peltula sp. TS41687]|nr:MAG: hypothetical protein M1816_005566 [Peltula sp. TS41687]